LFKPERMVFMGRLVKNIILVFSIPAVLITVFTYGFMAARKDSSTFFLRDLEGDRSVLNDIVISGYLEDRYHGRYFELKNGTLESSFLYYQHQDDIAGLKKPQNLVNAVIHNDFVYYYQFEYKISPGAKTEEQPEKNMPAANNPSLRRSTVFTDSIDIHVKITKRPADFTAPDFDLASLYLDPGLRYENSSMDIEFYRYLSDVEYQSVYTDYSLNPGSFPAPLPKLAMTVLNDELYFSVVCPEEYSGHNGIYKAVKFYRWWDETEYPGIVDTITEFSLDDPVIEAAGLEAVNDNLVLLLFENSVFKTRLYNTRGDLMDELAVPGITSTEGLPEYQGFINDNCLNIFLKYANEEGFSKYIVLSIMADEDNRLILKHRTEKNSTGEIYPFDIESRGDRLYIAAFTRNMEEIMKYSASWLTPGHFMIHAYETKNGITLPVYAGELVTDAADDYNRHLYTSDTSPGNLSYYRVFESVRIEQR